MTEPFNIEVEMSQAETLCVLRRRLLTNWRFVLTGCIVAIYAVWVFYTLGPSWGVPVGALFLGLVWFRWWKAPAIWLRRNPHLTERKTLHISSERLGLTTPTVKSELPWDYFLCWSESLSHFMLDLTKSGFCSIIPKQSMTPEQQQAFRDWATAKLPTYPQRLKK